MGEETVDITDDEVGEDKSISFRSLPLFLTLALSLTSSPPLINCFNKNRERERERERERWGVAVSRYIKGYEKLSCLLLSLKSVLPCDRLFSISATNFLCFSSFFSLSLWLSLFFFFIRMNGKTSVSKDQYKSKLLSVQVAYLHLRKFSS